MIELPQVRRSIWKPRFSLLTALLSTTTLAMMIALLQLWREVGPLRAEVRQLRAETGRLVIEDSTKIHVMAIIEPQTATNAWKWRVYLPDNRKYAIHLSTRPVLDVGYPKSQESIGASWPLDSGEELVEITVRKDGRDLRWLCYSLHFRRN